MEFSPEQQLAYDHFLKGKNVFITGGGGTGKSKWIRHVAHSSKRRVHVCALTGCAALLLDCNAKTVHSWAGIGLGDEDKALENSFTRKRWNSTDVLIVDEVSMMSADLFEMLNRIGQTIRKSSKPFGGIQIVFCGDFYQLPPIQSKFCFESPLWSTTFHHSIVFTTMYRQKNASFQTVMNEIRTGGLSESSLELLTTRLMPAEQCIKLVPTRKSADDINQTQYQMLGGEERIFKMTCTTNNKYSVDYLKKNVQCDDIIRLKVGTQVMCTVNLNENICNGSQGIVVALQPYLVVRFGPIEMQMLTHTWTHEKDCITQLPLIYAWAVTIHKAQGATLQKAEIDLGNSVFEYGQIYVALSRLTTLEGLFLTQFNETKIKSHPRVKQFYEDLEKISE